MFAVMGESTWVRGGGPMVSLDNCTLVFEITKIPLENKCFSVFGIGV